MLKKIICCLLILVSVNSHSWHFDVGWFSLAPSNGSFRDDLRLRFATKNYNDFIEKISKGDDIYAEIINGHSHGFLKGHTDPNYQQPSTPDNSPTHNDNCPSSENPIVFSSGKKYLNDVHYQDITAHFSFVTRFTYNPLLKKAAKSAIELYGFGADRPKIDISKNEDVYRFEKLKERGYKIGRIFLPKSAPVVKMKGKQYSYFIEGDAITNAGEPAKFELINANHTINEETKEVTSGGFALDYNSGQYDQFNGLGELIRSTESTGYSVKFDCKRSINPN
jgi:hypothetical protein